MSDVAQRVNFGPFLNSSNEVYLGIKVFHYDAGASTTPPATTNSATVWTDELKASPVASAAITDGDNNGVVSFFADGEYRFVITDSSDNILLDWDNYKVTAHNSKSSTATNLIVSADITLSAHTTIAAGTKVEIEAGAKYITNGFNLTFNGDLDAGLYQIFDVSGGGSVKGLQFARPEWFDSKRDGSTDDSTALDNAVEAVKSTAMTEFGHGTIKLARGIYKYGTKLDLDDWGILLEGVSMFDTILYYSGTDAAVRIASIGATIRDLTITSLDPATTGWLKTANLADGSAKTGIECVSSQCLIERVAVGHFSQTTGGSEGYAIDMTGASTFTNTIRDCYLRYNYIGINIDTSGNAITIDSNYIIDTTKCAIAVGYDFRTGASALSEINGNRILNNTIDNINIATHKDHGGDGFGIRAGFARTLYMAGNRMEGIDSVVTTGTAYGYYIDHGATASSCSGITITGSLISLESTGSTNGIYCNYCTGVNIFGNDISGGYDEIIKMDTNANGYMIGENYIPSSPAAPIYTRLGPEGFALDLINRRLDGGSIWGSEIAFVGTFDNHTHIAQHGRLYVNDMLVYPPVALANEATPSVLNGTFFESAGTTTITDFDDAVAGQIIHILSTTGTTQQITHNTSFISNSGGGNVTLDAGDVVSYIQGTDGVWYQLSAKGDG